MNTKVQVVSAFIDKQKSVLIDVVECTEEEYSSGAIDEIIKGHYSKYTSCQKDMLGHIFHVWGLWLSGMLRIGEVQCLDDIDKGEDGVKMMVWGTVIPQ